MSERGEEGSGAEAPQIWLSLKIHEGIRTCRRSAETSNGYWLQSSTCGILEHQTDMSITIPFLYTVMDQEQLLY